MREKAIAVTILVLLQAAAVIVLAGNPPVFLYSDQGDMVFYKALSSIVPVRLGGASESSIIVALDLNYQLMNSSSRGILADLVREAYNGKTVIIGYNTIRGLQYLDPAVLLKLGATVNYTVKGVVSVQPGNGLEFKPFNYDASKYGMAIVKAAHAKIMLGTEDAPILEEIPVGRGRLVIVAINPVAPYLETRDPAYIEFTAAIIRHYSNQGPSPILAAAIATAAAAAAYLSLSNNQRVEKLRNIIKWAIVSGGFKLTGMEVLENKLRRAIYDYIKEKEYTTVNDVAQTFSISRSNARWHLYVLQRAGLIEATTIQNIELYHLPGHSRKAVKEFLLENKLRRKIYELLLQGRSISEIARTLGVSKSTVSHHVRVLRETGVLED